jgi:hypothetical protein
MGANKEIETELEGFVRVDESVCKELEKRNDRYSPVRGGSKSMRIVEQMKETAYY